MVCDKAVCERWCVAKEQCAGSQDAVQSHQSMSLTAVTAQNEKFIAGQENVNRQPDAISATPATRNEGGCRQVPRLPRKTQVDVTKCHTCHAKRKRMSPSAMPATRNEGGCLQVPRLPRKVGRRHRRPSAPKRATRASPVP